MEQEKGEVNDGGINLIRFFTGDRKSAHDINKTSKSEEKAHVDDELNTDRLMSLGNDSGSGKVRKRYDPITYMIPNQDFNSYITASKEGSVNFWSPTNLNVVGTVGVPRQKPVGGKFSKRRISSKSGNGMLAMDKPYDNAYSAASMRWMSCVCFMQQSNRLAAASMNQGILLFDLSTNEKKLCGKINSRELKQATPICMKYHFDVEHGYELLMVGDDAGFLTVFRFPGNVRYTTTSTATMLLNKNKGKPSSTYERTSKDSSKEIQVFRIKKHSDHITDVRYVPDLSCILTSSLDSTIHALEYDKKKEKWEFAGHTKAIYAFVWCSSSKLISSCGLERKILVWSPYSRRVVARMSGHLSSIKQLIQIPDARQLVSLGTDSSIRVWSLKSFSCIQTISHSVVDTPISSKAAESTENKVCMILYDEKQRHLVAAEGSALYYWPIEKTFESNLSSHEHPVCTALYNSTFNQVVSVDKKFIVIWNLENGESICRYTADIAQNTVHSKKFSSQITCACFDDGGRRLISGGDCFKDMTIWNYSNGSALTQLTHERDDGDIDGQQTRRWKDPNSVEASRRVTYGQVKEDPMQIAINTFQSHSEDKTANTHAFLGGAEDDSGMSSELTCSIHVVMTLPRLIGQPPVQNKYIVSAGWDRKIHIWRDDEADTSKETGFLWVLGEDEAGHGHTDDIMTLAFCPPNLVASGGYDGKVVLWNLYAQGSVSAELELWDPVESLLYMNKLGFLVAGNSIGMLVFLTLPTGTMFSVVTSAMTSGRSEGDSICSLSCDQENEMLIAGNSSGIVKIWRVGNPSNSSFLFGHACWKATPNHRITSVSFIQHSRRIDVYAMTASSNGEVSLWTLKGEHIGMFGQDNAWSLSNVVSRKPNIGLNRSQENGSRNPAGSMHFKTRTTFVQAGVSADVNRLLPFAASTEARDAYRQKQLLDGQKVGVKSHFNGYHENPVVNDVWILMHPGMNVSDKNADLFVDVITVQYVNETQNIAKVWDGKSLSSESRKRQKEIKLSQLYGRAHNEGYVAWERNEALSNFIAKTIEPDYPSSNQSQAVAFKIVYIVRKEKTWYAVDTNFELHSLAGLLGDEEVLACSTKAVLNRKRSSQGYQTTHSKSDTKSSVVGLPRLLLETPAEMPKTKSPRKSRHTPADKEDQGRVPENVKLPHVAPHVPSHRKNKKIGGGRPHRLVKKTGGPPSPIHFSTQADPEISPKDTGTERQSFVQRNVQENTRRLMQEKANSNVRS
jgi:WD40 repeat protein